MNREELVRLVSRSEGIPGTEVSRILDGILSGVELSLAAGHAVNLRGFGVFDVRQHRATRRRPPGQGLIEIPAKISVGFKPSPVLNARISGDNNARTPDQP